MEDMSYYTKFGITLEDLAGIAEERGYAYSLTFLNKEKRLMFDHKGR
ncbi:MAG: hypothetical protein K8L99_15005 [Anaerolineae bacterium]|nr:hypothetical protein [Anaerolineae bacterium]